MRPEHWIYTVPLRLRSLFRRQQVEQDLEEEIRDHLESRTADYIAQGLPRAEARYAAQREFGGIEQAKERCRDMRKVNWIYDFAQDVRYTLRQSRKNLGFAVLAISILALGIGVNTAMFTVIDSVLIRSLPFHNADRLVSITRMEGQFEDSLSWSQYHDLRTRSHLLQDVMGIGGDPSVIETPQGGQKVARVTITANFLDALDLHPTLGRRFDSKDYEYGGAPVVLLSAELWRGPFGADPHIIGRRVRIGGVPYTVIGIMPDGFHFHPYDGDSLSSVWLPMQLSPSTMKSSVQVMRLVGRLRSGASPQAAQAELAAIVQNIYGPQGTGGLRYIVKPYRDALTASARPALLALTGAVFLVLVIACVNVANLQLARHQARRQELAVRAALGAGRRRLLRQLIAEGTVLAFAGALAGLGVALIVLLAVHRLPPNFIPRADEIQLRAPVFAMLAVFAAVTTILSSLVPALLATRTHSEEVLREGSGGATAGRKRSRFSEGMVAGEVALSAILLISTGLMFHTLYNLEHIHFGFDLERVTTFTATPGDAPGWLGSLAAQNSRAVPQTESVVTRVYQPILDRLRHLPGVVDVALSAWMPFDHNTMGVYFQLPGHMGSDQEGVVLSQICYVSSGYARAMGTPLIEGRMVSDDDTATSPLVAVVNETFARRLPPGQNPVGQQIVVWGSKAEPAEKTYTIVGVLGDARQHDLTHMPDPEVLMAYQQVPTTDFVYTLIVASGTNFILRTRGRIELTNDIRETFRQLAPGYAVGDFRTLRVAFEDATMEQRLGLYLIGIFAGVAALMVLSGLYGVLSQLVGQRRREIGIRMALGASRSSIQGMILRRGAILTFMGLAMGLPASLAVGRLLRAFTFGVKPIDGLTYLAVATVLLAVSIAAALVPARNATNTDFRAALQ